jgi:predicted amidohydrolase
MAEPPDVVRVACCQLRPQFGQPGPNGALIRDAVRAAAAGGARLIVLPELCTTGYVFASAAEARALAQPAEGGALDDWIAEAGRAGAVIVGGFAEIDARGALYNAAAVVDGSGVIAVYRKTHLWDTERGLFEAGGDPPPVVETPVGRIGVCVCYDLFFPELTRGLALDGADIIVAPTNSPRGAGDDPAPREHAGVSVARAAAHVNRVFVAVCDRHGEERGQDWIGRSVIVDPTGAVLADPPGDRAAILLADCDLATARDKRWPGTANDALADRRPDVYR